MRLSYIREELSETVSYIRDEVSLSYIRDELSETVSYIRDELSETELHPG